MGFYLICCVLLGLWGISYIGIIIWTRVNKERLLSTYKPGTVAHEATLKNIQLRRVPIVLVVIVFSTLGAVLLVQNLLEHHQDVAKEVITTAIILGGLLSLLPIYAVYKMYKVKQDD